jgi:hypothetical protein
MRLRVLTSLAFLAFPAPGLAAPTAGGSSRCRVPGARVWEQNDAARLLVRTNRASGPVLYGCVFEQGRVRRLAARADGVRRGTGKGPVLAGHWALYRARTDVGSALIRVNLLTGRRRIIDRPFAKYTLHTTNNYVLKPNGSLAWTTSTSLGPPAGDGTQTILRVVRVAERGSQTRDVDSATYRVFAERDPIPDESLRLSRDCRLLLWSHNGQRRRTPIS